MCEAAGYSLRRAGMQVRFCTAEEDIEKALRDLERPAAPGVGAVPAEYAAVSPAALRHAGRRRAPADLVNTSATSFAAAPATQATATDQAVGAPMNPPVAQLSGLSERLAKDGWSVQSKGPDEAGLSKTAAERIEERTPYISGTLAVVCLVFTMAWSGFFILAVIFALSAWWIRSNPKRTPGVTRRIELRLDRERRRLRAEGIGPADREWSVVKGWARDAGLSIGAGERDPERGPEGYAAAREAYLQGKTEAAKKAFEAIVSAHPRTEDARLAAVHLRAMQQADAADSYGWLYGALVFGVYKLAAARVVAPLSLVYWFAAGFVILVWISAARASKRPDLRDPEKRVGTAVGWLQAVAGWNAILLILHWLGVGVLNDVFKAMGANAGTILFWFAAIFIGLAAVAAKPARPLALPAFAVATTIWALDTGSTLAVGVVLYGIGHPEQIHAGDYVQAVVHLLVLMALVNGFPGYAGARALRGRP